MSLEDLTRNCFQSGISARWWLSLCKLTISRNPALAGSPAGVETALSNSVLVLYSSYPGDPTLLDYLRSALRDGMLSLAMLVTTFLQAVKSPEFHNASSLDILCRLVLNTHYASGLPPVRSVVASLESSAILSTVQDALWLLRIAHSLPPSHGHQLTASASELLMLLLSCARDIISQISTAQAMVIYADANDILQTMRLQADVRQILDEFIFSLSLHIGDDARIAREAQLIQSIHITAGKVDILETNSDSDIITCSLVLYHLVNSRASEFGSGNNANAVAMLVGTWRWSSWTPTVFYTQLVLSAFICVSNPPLDSPVLLWRAFVIGRLPRLLAMFEKAVKSDTLTEADLRTAIQKALTFVAHRTDLLAQCDRSLIGPDGMDTTQDGSDARRSVYRDFTQQLLAIGLVDHTFVVAGEPSSSAERSQLAFEAQESGLDLETYLNARFTPDNNFEDGPNLLDRIWHDPASHATFAAVILQRFDDLTRVLDVESLSHLCKLLYTVAEGLDIIALHVKVSDLIFYALVFLEDYDCETVGDPQTAVTHLGDVVLFIQSTLTRFKLSGTSFTLNNRTITTDLIHAPATIHAVDRLTNEDAAAFTSWFKALFDSSSEGIEDTMLRSTRPKTLLRICASLFSHAILACAEHKIDSDVLNNGVSYFLGPLLNWTLVGVIKALVLEIQLKGLQAPAHLEILQTLLLSPACPRPVLGLCSPGIMRLLRECKNRKQNVNLKFDLTAIQRVAVQSLGNPGATLTSTPTHPPDHPHGLIRSALSVSRAGKAPAVPISLCLTFLPPTQFLDIVWTELSVAASLGELEICRRLGTFVLTTPTTSRDPPLLPIFLHLLVPTLIASFDARQPLGPEQNMTLEFLVTLISSSLLCARHLEYALHSQGTSQSQNQPTSGRSLSMARRLFADLKTRKYGSRKSPTAGAITQRLMASQVFIASFPIVMGDAQ